MKKTVIIILWALAALALFIPCCMILCFLFEYRFELSLVEAYTFIISFLTVSAAAFASIFKFKVENKALQILIAILTPLSFVNSVLYILSSPSPFVIGNCAIYIFASFMLSAAFEAPSALKVVSFILSLLMIYPMAVFGIAALFAGNLIETKIVEAVDSPDGKYRAELISSDQGALGGDTYIDVYRNGIDAYIFKITGKPERVYCSGWMAYLNLDIYWKDNNHFIVGSKEHYFK